MGIERGFFGHVINPYSKPISFKNFNILTFFSRKIKAMYFSMELNFQQFPTNG